MKKFFLIPAILLICCVASISSINAQSTCDLTLAGTNYHGMTYEVTFEIFNAYYGFPGTSVAGPTSPPEPCDWGFNDNFVVNLDLDPDASEIYYLKASVDRYYNSSYVDTHVGYSNLLDLMSTDEYYAGNIPITVNF